MVRPLPKKGNPNQFQNYRTINLISRDHIYKIILRIIFNNHVKSKAEELVSEEQESFRTGGAQWSKSSAVEPSLRNMQKERDVFHYFIDFKKAFDWIWHGCLWHVLRGFKIK